MGRGSRKSATNGGPKRGQDSSNHASGALLSDAAKSPVPFSDSLLIQRTRTDHHHADVWFNAAHEKFLFIDLESKARFVKFFVPGCKGNLPFAVVCYPLTGPRRQKCVQIAHECLLSPQDHVGNLQTRSP